MGILVSKGSTSTVSFSTPQEILINKDDDSITAWQGGTWTVGVNNAAGASAVNIQDGGNSITVDGPLTDTQLRASAVPVSGPLTDTQLRASAVPISGTVMATQATGTNLHTVVDSGTVSATQGTSPWAVVGTTGTLTDRSGTVTTTSSQIMAANSSRKYLFIQNNSGTVLWFDFDVAAVTTQPSIRLNNNDTFIMEGNFVSTQAINMRSASGTQQYTAKEG